MKNLLLSLLLYISYSALGQSHVITHRRYALEDKLIPYRIKDKWGYADSARKIVIPVQYEAAELFDSNYGRVRQNGKIGVIDENGNYFIQPEFAVIEYDYSNGVFKVKKDSLSRWLYRAEDGNFVINPDDAGGLKIFSFGGDEPDIEDGGAGQMTFYKNNKAGFYSREYVDGKIQTVDSIAPVTYDSLFLDFGGVVAMKGGKWGMIRSDGSTIIPLTYDRLGRPNPYGMIQAKKKGKWGVINYSNKVVLPFEYDALHVDESVEGYFIYKDGLTGHFDPLTKILIRPRYKAIKKFRLHRHALVLTVSGKKGYIDDSGIEFFID